jgi:hypothetical protein
VREYCTPGSVWGTSGNWRPYRDGTSSTGVESRSVLNGFDFSPDSGILFLS